MRNILLFCLIAFQSFFIHAQCGADEIEIKVKIITDNWGYETSWKVINYEGMTIMQGGQGGVYDNHRIYSDSLCVAADGCFFFEISDDYGDGILGPPGGYELYADGILVSSGSNDIGSYAFLKAYCPEACAYILEALDDLQNHINGSSPLTIIDLNQISEVFQRFPECLAESDTMIILGKEILEEYDEKIGALFTTPFTKNGFSKTPGNNANVELARAMVALEQGIFDHVFTAEIYAAHPQLIHQWKFNACVTFPGYVDPPLDSTKNYSVMVLADFKDPDGMNPYYNINGDGTTHALRPTGFYLAPGSVSRVTVPADLVGKDYYIRVGSHEWDLSNKPVFKRLDRISKKFAINDTTIDVFNPLGGAISILVPYEAEDGIVEVSATNIVEAPFISIKSFHETQDISAELNKPGPWAIFESENVMYTIPKHSIIPGQYNLIETLQDWETALRGVNSVMARQIIPDKHNMYMIADVLIRSGAYSIGYPMSNTPLNYFDVPGPAYFIDGPGPNDEVNFHETGHALAMSKFPGEVEAVVNFPYIMAMNYGLGIELNEAVKYSFVPNTFDIDKTATHRMVSNTFGSERNISNTTKDEVRYQHRGYGHYFEIVHLLGWCPLRNFWKQEAIDFENGIDHGINDQDTDSRIIRMSAAAQADLRPLFHVFGILPKDTIAVQASFEQLNIPKSPAIYKRLQEYIQLIPADNAAFIEYAQSVYPDLNTNGPTDNPDYGVGWHYQKSLTYTEAEAMQRTATLQSIMDMYYPDGEPTGIVDPEVCCLLDTLEVSIENGEIIVSGGVAPYDVSNDITGNIQTVTVIDFDGCVSTEQITISHLSETTKGNIRVFPNPSDGQVQIEFGNLSQPVIIFLLDNLGRLIHTENAMASEVVSYQLPEIPGIYFLRITFEDGKSSSIMVVKK
jgi:hypothetical protein